MFISSIIELRYTAVHRQKVTTPQVQLFLEDAESLLNLLHDRGFTREISDVRCSLSDYVENLSAQSSLDPEHLRVIAREK